MPQPDPTTQPVAFAEAINLMAIAVANELDEIKGGAA